MALFRKKPVVIEAHEWWKNGDHPGDYEHIIQGVHDGKQADFYPDYQREHGWEGQVVRRYRHTDLDGDTPCSNCGAFMHRHGWIVTLEGGHIVCPGDWVITGVQGEMYPCKPAIFEATYESVNGETCSE